VSGRETVLAALAERLDLPQPARSRLLLEVAADLADLEAAYRARGLDPDAARARALERLDLSDEALRDLVRLHGSPLRRALDRLGETGRRRGERLGLVALLAFLVLGTGALAPVPGLLADSGRGVWLVAAVTIPGLLLAAAKAYAIWGRDEHDPRRLRRGLDALLALAGLAAAVGLVGWWLGLRDVAVAAEGAPEAALGFGLAWLISGSATVVVGIQAAVLLGLLWLALAGKVSRVEREEADLLLVGGPREPKGGGR